MPETTYDRLIRPIESAMTRAIWRILRDQDDVDDVMQEVFAKIWKDLRRIERHPNPHALIQRICVTTAIDCLRRKVRQRDRESDVPMESLSSDALAAVAAETEELYNAILNAVAQLPKNQAIAITMRLVNDEPYEAISAAIGCSTATVRGHVKRGRERLRQLLQHLNPNANREV